MNQITLNNQRHNEALKVVEEFERNGGKIQRFGVETNRPVFTPPKPKRLVAVSRGKTKELERY